MKPFVHVSVGWAFFVFSQHVLVIKNYYKGTLNTFYIYFGYIGSVLSSYVFNLYTFFYTTFERNNVFFTHFTATVSSFQSLHSKTLSVEYSLFLFDTVVV